MRFVLFLVLACISSLLAPRTALAVQERCDIPGGDLESFAAAAPAACAEACQGKAGCKGWVHVSGWGRCLLKTKVSRQAPLRMHAGHVGGDGAARKVTALSHDHDDSGKDLRRVSGIKTAEACGEACVGEPQCRAFAYLDGYGDCWLKKTQGKLRPKVFSCGLRTP